MTEKDPLEGEKPVASSLPGEVPQERAPEIPLETQGPQEPTPEDAFKKWADAVIQQLKMHDEAIEKQNAAIQKIMIFLESVKPQVAGEQAQAMSQGPSGFLQGIDINKLLDLAKDALGGGGDPMESLYRDMGKRLVDGALDTSVKKVIREVGGEAAIHVTHG